MDVEHDAADADRQDDDDADDDEDGSQRRPVHDGQRDGQERQHAAHDADGVSRGERRTPCVDERLGGPRPAGGGLGGFRDEPAEFDADDEEQRSAEVAPGQCDHDDDEGDEPERCRAEDRAVDVPGRDPAGAIDAVVVQRIEGGAVHRVDPGPLGGEADPEKGIDEQRAHGGADQPCFPRCHPQRVPRGGYGSHMAVFLRKLLRIGGLPDELRTEVEAEGLIYLAEYVPVTRRFSGSVPGKRANTNISSYVGSLAITPQRVLGTLSSVPKLAGRTIDQRWDADQSGPVKADLSSTGLHIEVNIGEVDPKFEGQLSLNYKTAIPEDVLMRVPRRSLAFEVPPEYVLRAVGVPARG